MVAMGQTSCRADRTAATHLLLLVCLPIGWREHGRHHQGHRSGRRQSAGSTLGQQLQVKCREHLWQSLPQSAPRPCSAHAQAAPAGAPAPRPPPPPPPNPPPPPPHTHKRPPPPQGAFNWLPRPPPPPCTWHPMSITHQDSRNQRQDQQGHKGPQQEPGVRRGRSTCQARTCAEPGHLARGTAVRAVPGCQTRATCPKVCTTQQP